MASLPQLFGGGDASAPLISRRELLGMALAYAPALLGVGKDYLNAVQEGLVRDGVTDNLPALRSLISRHPGKSIYLPGGPKPYRFDLSGQSPVVIPTGTEIWGDAQTVLELVTSKPGFTIFADLRGDHIRLHDLQLNGNFAPGSQGWVFSFSGEQGRIENVRLDLRNREVAPGKSLHSMFGFYPSATRPSAGWVFDSVQVDRSQRALVRLNLDRASHSDIVFRSCVFRRAFSQLFTFNSPSAAIPNALITDCRFEGNPLASKPDLLLGMTGTVDSTVRRCTFTGVCIDALHIEQDTRNLLITDCQFDILGNGVKILDNNVGGHPASPSHIVIQGNVFSGRTPAVGQHRGRGIWCVWDNSGRVAAESVSALGNQVRGFEVGIDLGDVPSGGIVTQQNLVSGCGTGIRALVPSPGVIGNHLQNCGVGLASHHPGAWPPQIMEGCQKEEGTF